MLISRGLREVAFEQFVCFFVSDVLIQLSSLYPTTGERKKDEAVSSSFQDVGTLPENSGWVGWLVRIPQSPDAFGNAQVVEIRNRQFQIPEDQWHHSYLFHSGYSKDLRISRRETLSKQQPCNCLISSALLIKISH